MLSSTGLVQPVRVRYGWVRGHRDIMVVVSTANTVTVLRVVCGASMCKAYHLMTDQMMWSPTIKQNTLVLEKQPRHVNTATMSMHKEPTLGERVLGRLTECRSLLTASVMSCVSTSSSAQHRFFTVCTTRSTVLYWVLWKQTRRACVRAACM